jgi:hypothetical protein
MKPLNLIGVLSVAIKKPVSCVPDIGISAKFDAVKSANIEFVSNGAKITVNGESNGDNWTDLEFVVTTAEELKEALYVMFTLRKL